MDTFPDLGALSDQELKDLIQQLTEEEQEVSYQRRILHGKIDILRAELVNRLRKKHETGEDGEDHEELPGDRSFFKKSVAQFEKDLIMKALRDAAGLPVE